MGKKSNSYTVQFELSVISYMDKNSQAISYSTGH
jgi:hypothetical protein